MSEPDEKRGAPPRQVGTVYLLHFSRPYRHARHYLGFSRDVTSRVRSHCRGRGSPLVRAAVECGIEIFIARRWEVVTRAFERRAHVMGGVPSRGSCPICFGPPAFRRCNTRRDPETGIGV